MGHEHVGASVILSPKAAYDHIAEAGEQKTKLRLDRGITLGFLAGCYISFSWMLTMVVGGLVTAFNTDQYNLPGLYNLIYGSIGFPLGLSIICIVGGDLFTSSCMYYTIAVWEGRASILALLRGWIQAWFCNLCGCLFMAQLCMWNEVYLGREQPVIDTALHKVHNSFGVTVAKGIICNWMVCLATYMANQAQDLTGKVVGIYLPISAFVSLGMEHCIANQYILAAAYMLGAPLTVNEMITKNLIPATIGNIIGGAGFVATLYAGSYGRAYDVAWAQWLRLYCRVMPRSSQEHVLHGVQVYDHVFLDTWPAHTAGPISGLQPTPSPTPASLPRDLDVLQLSAVKPASSAVRLHVAQAAAKAHDSSSAASTPPHGTC